LSVEAGAGAKRAEGWASDQFEKTPPLLLVDNGGAASADNSDHIVGH
jgi:hypothetical protein